jgi:F-type H+-transporting ATPase subunit b
MSLHAESVISLGTSARAAGGVEVDFDASLIVQIVLFLVLLAVLKPLLFDPMLHLFEEREKRIEGARLQARKTDEASAGALAKYEAAMQKARATANAERDRLRAEGLATENEILAKVRASTAATLDQGRARIKAEVETARTALRQDVGTIARELAARVLGREVH